MSADLVRATRWRSTAATWFQKAAAILAAAGREAATEAQQAVVGYEAEALLWRVLFESGALVDLIRPESLENCEQLAKELAKEIRRRRLAAVLGQVEGRTPAEADAFREKAASLAPRG